MRISAASHISLASAVRAILSDVVPKMVSVLDYVGTNPTLTPTDVADADAWLRDLEALYARAPETFRDALGDLRPHVDPPESGAHD